MYKIDRTEYGLRLFFGETIDAREMNDWLRDFSAEIDKFEDTFLVFVDMRTLIPLKGDAREIIGRGQKYARENGMLRSVVILRNPVITMQFKGIAHETGIYGHERYIDASTTPDWEQVGLEWLLNKKDPDQIYIVKERA